MNEHIKEKLIVDRDQRVFYVYNNATPPMPNQHLGLYKLKYGDIYYDVEKDEGFMWYGDVKEWQPVGSGGSDGTYKGLWIPSGGSEYPINPTDNDYWIIDGLAAPYTFTSGDLSGETVDNGDSIIFDGTKWIIKRKADFVTSSSTSTLNLEIAAFDGTNGKVIRGGGITMFELGAELNNKVSIVKAGTGILVDNTDPQEPIVSSEPFVTTVLGGSNVTVNNANPQQPIINANVGTTAGLINKVYFTGDVVTVGGNDYYETNVSDRGTVASVEQTISVADNEKKWFAQDAISVENPIQWIVNGGDYEAQLTAKTNINGGEQRYTLEIYLTDSVGTPVDSGVASMPIGDLGVKPIMILNSGIIDMYAGNETNIVLSGFLEQDFTVPAHNRFRYHFSAEKIGTAGGTEILSLYFGSDYHSYLKVPVEVTTDGVKNESNVKGGYLTEALNNLVQSDTSVAAGSIQVTNMITLTQAQYDGIGTKDPNTVYNII